MPQQRNALQDASERANRSPARATTQKAPPVLGETGDPENPSFEEYLKVTGLPAATQKRILKDAVAKHGVPGSVAAAAAAPPPPPKGKKRKSDATSYEEDVAAYKQDLEHVISTDNFEDEALPSCNVVRGKITRLLDAGIMTKTEFGAAIGASCNVLNRFLSQRGPTAGSGSSVYYNAFAWFRQREHVGLKFPDAKKRQRLEEAAAGPSSGSGGKSSSSSKSSGPAAAALPDISAIELPGEDEDDVPVYDSCDEVRRKLAAHLRKTPGLTQAQLCRDLYAQLRAPRCKAIQSKQLADFRAHKGARGGAKSTVYYAAYVYFEKLRLARGQPKSAHREASESPSPERPACWTATTPVSRGCPLLLPPRWESPVAWCGDCVGNRSELLCLPGSSLTACLMQWKISGLPASTGPSTTAPGERPFFHLGRLPPPCTFPPCNCYPFFFSARWFAVLTIQLQLPCHCQY
ncbi:hypothetical protein GGR56DRAFT_467204 [Xylariaceae sp. FL0804]|nr:hypothetical protein GGR56DRAFT_467204 [Xylariaceae sp. FL0804]